MAESMPNDGEDECPSLEDDYYSLFNVDKNATQEEITAAYRRLSLLFHPDKHEDPEQKAQAEILFNKVKKAFEILNDPQKRAIYDALGTKGIQTDGWLIVERTKTPKEIREEYEQLMQQKEERRLQQMTNPRGLLIVKINATDIFEFYEEEYSFPSLEISSISITQSIDTPLNLQDTFKLNGNVLVQNGTGSGNIGFSYRKITSPEGWMEMGIGAGAGPVFNLKGFHRFSTQLFSSLQGTLHFTPMGLAPAIQGVIGQQLTRHVWGFLTYTGGHDSSMKTTLVWNSNNGYHFDTDIQFGIRGNFFSCNYRYKLNDETGLKASLKFGTNGTVFEYGCEKKISSLSEVSAFVALGIPSGVTLKLKVNRGSQSYIFPILLSEDLIPSAAFYATVIPVVSWYLLKVMVLNPLELRKKQKMKEENATKLAEKREEAKAAVNLMQETYNRIKTQEESKKGLIIIQAYYGSPEDIKNLVDAPGTSISYLDATIQLQCLVKDSRLILPARSKSNLTGFYDPCLGEEKCLMINYSYKGIVHSITIKDEEILRIPNER